MTILMWKLYTKFFFLLNFAEFRKKNAYLCYLGHENLKYL